MLVRFRSSSTNFGRTRRKSGRVRQLKPNFGQCWPSSARSGTISPQTRPDSTVGPNSINFGRFRQTLAHNCPSSAQFGPEIDQLRRNCDQNAGHPGAEGEVVRKECCTTSCVNLQMHMRIHMFIHIRSHGTVHEHVVAHSGLLECVSVQLVRGQGLQGVLPFTHICLLAERGEQPRDAARVFDPSGRQGGGRRALEAQHRTFAKRRLIARCNRRRRRV